MPVILSVRDKRHEVRWDGPTPLAEIIEQAGLRLNTRCGGKGICGSCSVTLCGGEYIISGQPVTVAPKVRREAPACQTIVRGPEACIEIPDRALLEADAKIDHDFVMTDVKLNPRIIRRTVIIPPPDTQRPESDRDRLERALHLEQDVHIPLFALRKLPAAIALAEGVVTITLASRRRMQRVIDIEPGHVASAPLGVAVDIGTTTVVAMLLDLASGATRAKASMYNQQIARADDVASRISYCDSPSRIHEMQRLILDATVNELIGELCSSADVSREHIYRMAFSGNTVMTHLMLGIDPRGIGVLPFQPVTNVHQEYQAGELGIRIHPEAIVDIVPSIAGYIGGDITADICVSAIQSDPSLTLLVDIGTNGEMVLSENGRLSAAATAAGPAFEGAGIAHGRRAMRGAIEHLDFDASLDFDVKTIGGGPPCGLCGSAIVDFIACGFRCGLISAMGRYDLALLKKHTRYYSAPSANGTTTHACVIIPTDASDGDGPIYVSELDISQILKAKAAIYAGMKTLLSSRGKTFADLASFVLAGGFARYLDFHNAVTIGLLPDIPYHRVDVIGNGSLAGACRALLDQTTLACFLTTSSLPEVIELNRIDTFEADYIDAMPLPHADPAEFPSVTGHY